MLSSLYLKHKYIYIWRIKGLYFFFFFKNTLMKCHITFMVTIFALNLNCWSINKMSMHIILSIPFQLEICVNARHDTMKDSFILFNMETNFIEDLLLIIWLWTSILFNNLSKSIFFPQYLHICKWFFKFVIFMISKKTPIYDLNAWQIKIANTFFHNNDICI